MTEAKGGRNKTTLGTVDFQTHQLKDAFEGKCKELDTDMSKMIRKFARLFVEGRLDQCLKDT